MPKELSCRHYYPQKDRNFNNLGVFENRPGQGMSLVSEQTAQTVDLYLVPPAPKTLPEDRRCRLGIPYSTILDMLKKLVHMFSLNVARVYQLPQQDYAQRSASSQLYGQHVARFQFLTSDRFSDESVFHVTGFANTQTCILGHRKPKRNSTT